MITQGRENREIIAQFFLQPDFQQLMKKYHKETGKWSNLGQKLHSNFKNWIKNNPNIENNEKIEYLNKIEEINQNNAISYLVIDKIKNTNKSQHEIAVHLLSEFGIKISRKTVGNIAKEELNEKQYINRFPSFEKIDKKTRDAIIKLIKNTNKSQQEIADHILSEFGIKISHKTVANIAKEELTKGKYSERFFSYEKVDKETRDAVIELIKTTNKSQRQIADYVFKKYKIKISFSTVASIAKEKLTEKQYNKRFPVYPWRIDKKVRNSVIKLIKTTGDSQLSIAAQTLSELGIEISPRTIANIAKDVLTEKQYSERFPSYEKVDKKTRDAVLKLIKTTKDTLQEIADNFSISPSSVSRFAKEFFKTKKEYEARFPQEERPRLGQLFHEVVTNEFSDWGRKRGVKILSEYNIIKKFPRFKKIGRRPDNLIVVDNKFRKSFDIPLHIKYIALDYSLDPSQKKFIKKSEKGYQAADILFIFVPFAFDKKNKPKIEYRVPKDLSNKENIWVLPPKQFFSFFNFTDEEKKLFVEHIWNIYRKSKKQKSLLET